ncbi:hypothetical protein [Rhizobium sp. C4]|uniref:hypothetical protein n=1 Tax=Rhizobium sp. C4 TaxID=1349800 RepID=UPI001E5F4AF2|nr:hypothetical protein [Rhizobium sp. C4]MCD2171623.1 hypothetical protein [Rhizobium sp. C4]
MSLIRNERTKLLANALDRASTACAAAGFIAPAVAASVGSGTIHISVAAAFATIAWLFAAVALHFAGRHVLGRLQP